MLVLGTIAVMVMVFLALTLLTPKHGIEASVQQCKDDVLKKIGCLF